MGFRAFSSGDRLGPRIGRICESRLCWRETVLVAIFQDHEGILKGCFGESTYRDWVVVDNEFRVGAV